MSHARIPGHAFHGRGPASRPQAGACLANELARSLGITGITTAVGVQGIGRDVRLHSAQFVELSDQPVELAMTLGPQQCDMMFARLEAEKANVFYMKTPVESGVLGHPSDE
jgi:uncharacterized protein